MLARLGKTLSTNAAIGGLALLVLGAGGAGATLTSGSSTPKPEKTQKAEKTEKAQKSDASEETEGVRPTDTHGYCVSQVAHAKPVKPTGTGPDKVNHGSLVREAAHACGKQDKAGKSDKAAKGKGHGRGHGKGRPSTVTPGTPSS